MSEAPPRTRPPHALFGWAVGDLAARSSYYGLTFLLPVLVLRSGGTSAALVSGIVGACFYWPIWLMSPVAGRYVDRVGDAPVILWSGVLRFLAASAVLVLVVLTTGTWPWAVCAVILGMCASVHDVAIQSAPARFFDAADLNRVNGVLQGVASLTPTAGPAFAGLLVATGGEVLASAAMSALALVGVVVLRAVVPRSEGSTTGSGIPLTFRSSLQDIARHRPILATCCASAWYNGTAQAFQTVMLVHLVAARGVDELTVGLIVGAGGVGVLVGSWFVSTRSYEGMARPAWLVACLTLSFVATLLGVLQYHLSGSVVAFAAALAVNGFFLALYNVPAITIRQRTAERAHLGSLTGTYRLLVMGTIPIGAVVGGWLAQALDPSTALWLLAVGGLLGSLLISGALFRRNGWEA